MSPAYCSPEDHADHERDLHRHSLTNREIIAELDRIERDMREAVTRSQAASREAMKAISDLMDTLGLQKGPAR